MDTYNLLSSCSSSTKTKDVFEIAPLLCCSGRMNLPTRPRAHPAPQSSWELDARLICTWRGCWSLPRPSGCQGHQHSNEFRQETRPRPGGTLCRHTNTSQAAALWKATDTHRCPLQEPCPAVDQPYSAATRVFPCGTAGLLAKPCSWLPQASCPPGAGMSVGPFPEGAQTRVAALLHPKGLTSTAGSRPTAPSEASGP